MMRVTILGCGWLGFPLALELLEEGMEVKGSTRSPEKCDLLRKEGIDAHLLDLDPESQNLEALAYLLDCDCVVINIPPGRSTNRISSYINGLRVLSERITNRHFLIFVSSTGVFSGRKSFYDEKDLADVQDSGSSHLIEAENLIKKTQAQSTILRLAGLLDKDRNFAVSLQRKGIIPEPSQPMNIIHRRDCIRLILKIIQENAWGKIFHGVAPIHPLRKDFYAYACRIAGLPEFEYTASSQTEGGKIVSGQWTAQFLNYSYLYPDPLKMLDHEL